MSISILIDKYGILSDEIIRKYTKQIIDDLKYLYSNDFIHKK